MTTPCESGKSDTPTDLARRLALSELVADVSRRFIELPVSDIGDGIDDALQRVVDACGFARATVVEVSADRRSFSVSHRRTAPGAEVLFPLHVQQPLEPFRWLGERLAATSPVVLSDATLPPDAHERVLLSGGTEWHVFVPLMLGSDLLGAVAIGAYEPPDDALLEALSSVGRLFTSARDRQRADRVLRDRLRFEEALVEASSRLVRSGDLDASIREILGDFAKILQLDRIGIFADVEGRALRMTHEWCDAGVKSLASIGAEWSFERFPWPLSDIRDGRTTLFGPEDAPQGAEEVRRLMEKVGVLMIATVPLVVDGEARGCIAFQRLHSAVRPDDHQLSRLRLVGEMLGGTLARRDAQASLRKAFDEISRLKLEIEGERDYLRELDRAEHALDGMVAHSDAMRSVLDLVASVAVTSATALVVGESGVGKELIARAIHAASGRADRPLVKVNCASIPKELFESEFFGHLRGAFTGAYKDRAGRFELADSGTLFLDEIGEIPLNLQAKLLRVLQEGEFERVGDDRTRKVDVRLIAATNRDLGAEVAAGRFRADLYYRLSVFPIDVPPLRERRTDIVPLTEHFLKQHCRAAGRRDLTLQAGHASLLESYDWPGNVRELAHVVERAVILSSTPPLRLEAALQVATPPSGAAPADELMTASALRKLERENILRALERCSWRISGPNGAAAMLGLNASTLRARMVAFEIQREGS